ncbi:MAG: signal peptidase II [Parachlamydiaceae bacterium]|nr:signal peptidase II [Parachlamydiaceae bacterium]
MLRFFPLFIGIFVFALDFFSKFFTNMYLPVMHRYAFWYPYGGIGVFKDFFGIEFSLSHQINYGAAWGMFSDYQIHLMYFRIFLLIALIIYAFFFNKHAGWRIPLTLIIVGALGNVVDFFIYGHVVDMLHFVLWGYDFPVFNIADSAIFLGITSLILLSAFEKDSPSKNRSRNNN